MLATSLPSPPRTKTEQLIKHYLVLVRRDTNLNITALVVGKSEPVLLGQMKIGQPILPIVYCDLLVVFNILQTSQLQKRLLAHRIFFWQLQRMIWKVYNDRVSFRAVVDKVKGRNDHQRILFPWCLHRFIVDHCVSA